MRKISLTNLAAAALLTLFALTTAAFGAESVKEVQIKTSAQCEMCKTRIEKAVNEIEGVKESDLSLETKILTVKYDESKTDPDAIRKVVTKTGYDADGMPANPKAYNKLPKCCKKGGHGN